MAEKNEGLAPLFTLMSLLITVRAQFELLPLK